MSISSLVTTSQNLKSKWQSHVMQSRPSEESTLKSYLGQDSSYQTVFKQMDGWHKSLKNLSQKPRISLSISKPLSEALAQCFAGISFALDNAGNGIDWICAHRSLGANIALANLLVREITSDQAREAAVMVDAAKERIASDLVSIQHGNDFASRLLADSSKIETQIENLEEASDAIDEQKSKVQQHAENADKAINKSIEEIDALKTEKSESITESFNEYSELLAESKKALIEAQVLKSKIQGILDTSGTAHATTEIKLKQAEENLKTATERQVVSDARLTKALQSAQMEGLAGSFTKKSAEIKIEIDVEKKSFERALVYLALVGVISLIVEINFGFAKTQDEFIFRLIRTLSFAAPGIWVAWIAARKLGALNRVFSDYQYKSASALAYESYRQTVAEAGDDELKKQLLAFAIRSFGENPTRYYDSANADPASPGESWLAHLFSWKKSAPSKD